MREKDRLIAEDCRRMAEAAALAREWLDDNARRVGLGMPTLRRNLKKDAVEARRLGEAAERPTSIGVFGPSQAGKSFLVGALTSRRNREARVVFGQGDGAVRLDFGKEVNPQGGNETTGLVTRLTLREMETPDGHPVALRMLTELDVVRILANTFMLDLSRVPAEDAPDPIDLALAADEAGLDERPEDGLKPEDVFALREYIETSLEMHPLAQPAAASYWDSIETAVPKLRGPGRARLFAPLWGGHAPFTELFMTLKEALDRLGHPEWAFAPLEAIDQKVSILHVKQIKGLDLGGGGPSVPLKTFAGPGAVSIARPLVTALTRELRVTLDSAPYPFFETTDMLDFPGARARFHKQPKGILYEDPSSPQRLEGDERSECFLRGKVAVLFDIFSADLDLNTMLLCTDERNNEVHDLPLLVNHWIANTHGATPAMRAGGRTALFLSMNKCDTLLNDSVNASAEGSVGNRFSKDFEFYARWAKEWTPGRAFNNTFVIRNPNFKRGDLFEYEEPPEDLTEAEKAKHLVESGVRGEAQELVNRTRGAFLHDPLVTQHVDDAQECWDAMMALNDGGISYLVDKLAPVCDPELKYGQIAPRVGALRKRLDASLAPYFEDDDVATRIKQRSELALTVTRRLAKRPALIGRFIAVFTADADALADQYMLYAKRPVAETCEGSSMIILGFEDEGLGDARDAEAGGFGRVALDSWLEELERKTEDPRRCAHYGLDGDQMRFVVDELRVAARRLGLAQDINKIYDALPPALAPIDRAPRAGLGAALAINALVQTFGANQPGEDLKHVEFERPEPVSPGETPAIAEDVSEMRLVRGRYPGQWLQALRATACNNAAWSGGGFVDPEQNARLGEILRLIRGRDT